MSHKYLWEEQEERWDYFIQNFLSLAPDLSNVRDFESFKKQLLEGYSKDPSLLAYIEGNQDKYSETYRTFYERTEIQSTILDNWDEEFGKLQRDENIGGLIRLKEEMEKSETTFVIEEKKSGIISKIENLIAPPKKIAIEPEVPLSYSEIWSKVIKETGDTFPFTKSREIITQLEETGEIFPVVIDGNRYWVSPDKELVLPKRSEEKTIEKNLEKPVKKERVEKNVEDERPFYEKFKSTTT